MPLPEPLQLLPGNRVRWRGRTLLYFAGCDYFRLSQHPRVLAALHEGARQFGVNVAASRMTTGEHVLYARLEAALADFFAAPAALLAPGGYSTSALVTQALAGEFTHALLDERAHPALRDAALHLGVPVQTFAHRDAAAVHRLVRHSPRARWLLLTDGLFAQDGSVAPLAEYRRVLPPTATLLVDDAHGAGVLGEHGRGTPEFCGVSRARLIQCLTLSKAFGVYGGAVLGTRALREKIIARSRAFTGCTPLPLPLANAALAAMHILRASPQLRERLHSNAARVKDALRSAGRSVPPHPGPILALHPANEVEAERWRQALRTAGIHPPYLRYGARRGWFRFVISSEHTCAQLDRLVRVLTALR
jgi:7-keto-8-aminopelargonate synthetase-like enzyme